MHLKESETSIYYWLDKIQQKPGLYLGKVSLQRLEGFLTGYQHALGELGMFPKDIEHLHGFHAWVATKLEFGEPTSGWCNMITERSASDEEAFRHFFELLEEYRRCRQG